MDDKEVDNNDNNRLVSEPEGDHVETPSEDVGMAVRRTKDGHEEATDPGSPFQDDRCCILANLLPNPCYFIQLPSKGVTLKVVAEAFLYSPPD